jgi:hypothetical protein
MKVDAKSLEWAVSSVHAHGDTDLFPRLIEFEAMMHDLAGSVAVLADLDLGAHQPGRSRRFVVPKDDLSFRPTTQLDPIDSVLFTALIHQFGSGIEARRRPLADKTVFSYRFDPSPGGDLFPHKDAWNDFWSHAAATAAAHPVAAIVDISDFYNQIYHHTVENQLIESGLPNQASKWVIRLLEAVTAKVSRGVPVGPHPAHLLAEASLIPVDNTLVTEGIKFCRFVDDIVLFCDDENDVRPTLLRVAEILDKQQRLQLNRGKTQLLARGDFVAHAKRMLEDRPLDDLEDKLVSIIKKHSGGNPYATVFLNQLSEGELQQFDPEVLEKILDGYLGQADPDFIRMRWFLRRLAQVGHWGAVNYCVKHLPSLAPAVSEVCQYFVSVNRAGQVNDWKDVGKSLVDLLNHPIVKANEYFALSILSLFSMQPDLNHLPELVGLYKNAPPFMRREVITAAGNAGAADWLRGLKESAGAMDPWTRWAFLCACRTFPPDERKFFLQHLTDGSVLEKLLSKWARYA